jgi:hypothetical protein
MLHLKFNKEHAEFIHRVGNKLLMAIDPTPKKDSPIDPFHPCWSLWWNVKDGKMSELDFLQKVEDEQEKMEIQKAKNFKQHLREETKSKNMVKCVDANNMTTTPMTIQ